jgi:hypothetical protein
MLSGISSAIAGAVNASKQGAAVVKRSTAIDVAQVCFMIVLRMARAAMASAIRLAEKYQMCR